MQMNDRVSDRLLEALRCFPEGKKAEWDTEISAEEWMELFRMAASLNKRAETGNRNRPRKESCTLWVTVSSCDRKKFHP